jgi:hypothetical protein
MVSDYFSNPGAHFVHAHGFSKYRYPTFILLSADIIY